MPDDGTKLLCRLRLRRPSILSHGLRPVWQRLRLGFHVRSGTMHVVQRLSGSSILLRRVGVRRPSNEPVSLRIVRQLVPGGSPVRRRPVPVLERIPDVLCRLRLYQYADGQLQLSDMRVSVSDGNDVSKRAVHVSVGDSVLLLRSDWLCRPNDGLGPLFNLLQRMRSRNDMPGRYLYGGIDHMPRIADLLPEIRRLYRYSNGYRELRSMWGFLPPRTVLFRWCMPRRLDDVPRISSSLLRSLSGHPDGSGPLWLVHARLRVRRELSTLR